MWNALGRPAIKPSPSSALAGEDRMVKIRRSLQEPPSVIPSKLLNGDPLNSESIRVATPTQRWTH